jgi:hypothetical protein
VRHGQGADVHDDAHAEAARRRPFLSRRETAWVWYATVPGASKLPWVGKTEIPVAFDKSPPPDVPGLRGELVYSPGGLVEGDYRGAERAGAKFAQWAAEVYRLTPVPLP